jgi:hypothetical protein
MQAAQDASLGARVVVLDELPLESRRLLEHMGIEAFVEESALIAEDLWLQYQYIREYG